MISKLNEKALSKAGQTAFGVAVIRKINELVRAINEGVVWDNNINAQQAITELDLLTIENGIATTELELMMLEMGVANVSE